MNRRSLSLMMFSLVALVATALAPFCARADFPDEVKLGDVETLAVQHVQTLKTFDSFARQVVSSITGRNKLDGKPAVYTVLDMQIRPGDYVRRNIIKVKNVPLREDIGQLPGLDAKEKQRILQEGTISLEFFVRPEVQTLLQHVAASAAHKNSAVQQLDGAASTLAALVVPTQGIAPAAMIPPPASKPDDHVWKQFDELTSQSTSDYGDKAALIEQARTAIADFKQAWLTEDAIKANQHIATLAEILPKVNPDWYPTAFKRDVEVAYNRMAKLTIPGAALYFVAFVCFLVAARAGTAGLRLWGLRVFALALLVHTLAIGIRWWLVSETHGNWFDGIPIKNQYESVLFSAWFGAVVGFGLELWKGRGIFGAAAAFCGWMSLIAIFATPYVTGREIGGEIGQVAGVLMSYWLYIHVTAVVASYALIAMSFAIGVWWLVYYYMHYGTVTRVPARQLSDDAADDMVAVATAGGAGALSIGQTLARVFFVPARRAEAKVATSGSGASSAIESSKTRFLAMLDQCHMVVLHLAFWMLGGGIILGAVWADQSWGRPWGWDPKETFALVTWIVYLIVVHVRFVTEDKAWWTAVLSIIGFAVMLFNWIGVNFFLVGLHSYA